MVGGYSVILHGYSRTTGDLDIWVQQDKSNYHRLEQAFAQFKMPLFDMTLDNFMNSSTFDVFRYGRPPVAIDIMTQVKGLSFDDCWERAMSFTVEEVPIQVIQLQQLIKAKRSSDRHKDRDDIENLTHNNE